MQYGHRNGCMGEIVTLSPGKAFPQEAKYCVFCVFVCVSISSAEKETS